MKNFRIIIPFCLIIMFSFWLISCGEQHESQENIFEQTKASPTIINEQEKSPTAKPTDDLQEVKPAQASQVAEKINNFDYEKSVVNISMDDLLQRIAERNNKPLFLNFWAAWCVPCVEEFPFIVDLQKEFGDKIDFILVSCDKFTGSTEKVAPLLKALHVKFETLILQEENQKKFTSAIDDKWMGSMPFTIIYDVDGKKAHRLIGGRSKEEFKAVIEEVIQAE
jgi:thiol-disulfide isomerase/thioredoxin